MHENVLRQVLGWHFCSQVMPLILITSGVVFGQTPCPILIPMPVRIGSTTVSRLSFHNDRAVPATAWIIARDPMKDQAGHVSIKSETIDTVLGRGAQPVAPDSDGVASTLDLASSPGSYHFVSVLFADGSVCGDQTWASVIVSGRRDEFRIVTNAITDLEAAKQMSTADAVSYLESSRTRQIEAAEKEKASAAGPVFSQVSPEANAHVYEESTDDLKRANVGERAINNREGRLKSFYSNFVATVQGASPETLASRIQQTEQVLRAELHNLSESLPALFP